MAYFIWALVNIFISFISQASSLSCPCVYGICNEKTHDVITNDGPECFCYNGYTGKDCSINFDECLPGRNPCQNNATCINDVPEVKCLCHTGFCGKYCEMEINECQSNPCLNGATCIDKLNGFECVCPVGYSGSRCDIDIDACIVDLYGNQTIRCHNGGTCKDGPGKEYFCICPHGFTGTHCETIINPCDSSPCLNQGRCEKIAESFKCTCPYGWFGVICQKRFQKCAGSNECKNNALCMMSSEDNVNEYYCFCPPDFYGRFCQFRFNECQPNNCKNGATCIDQLNGYTCLCPSGFAGSFCEINCLEEINELCYISETTNPAILEPSMSVLPTSVVSRTNLPATLVIETIEPSSLVSIAFPNMTSTIIVVKPSPTIQFPLLIPDGMDVKNIHHIYAPSFNGFDSEVVFKMRRIKRLINSVKMTIISQKDDGIILYAYTNKFNLLIYLERRNIIIELNDQYQQNLLYLESNVLIETFRPYVVKVIITSQARSLNAELSLLSDNQLIHSVNIQKQNLTLPCFEWFQLGKPPLITDNKLFLRPFKGCIFNVELNNEEKFIKDSIRAKNISECLSNVCQQNPCRNQGVCRSSEQADSTWNCSCPPGYRGWLCQEVYCDSEYCFNGGLCLLGDLNNKHLCICPQGFLGSRCEFRMNLTFPSFNIGANKSFIKYRLSYNIEEFFEIRFRFIAHPAEQKAGLLMFMSQIPSSKMNSSEITKDFVSLIYEQKLLYLRLNLGQGEKTLKASTESNMTEQMVLFGRFRQVFWLLVIPSGLDTKLRPQVGRTPLHQAILNVDPYLYVGGHEDWQAHPALYNLTGFKGCIYDIEIRISRQSDFSRIEENLIDNLANIDQCDFECTSI